jgi:hypothetical protein
VAGFSFDPNRVAHAEAAGWRAYYDHRWPKMLQLMMKLSREQFHMPYPASILAAYYTVQAGRHWIPKESAKDKARYYLWRFYRQARAHSGLEFDPTRASELELAYWDIARKYKQGSSSRDEFVRAMTDLHSAVFGITPEQAARSAELRVQANELVDEIVQATVKDPEKNWVDLEEKLRQCYRSIQEEMATGAETLELRATSGA